MWIWIIIIAVVVGAIWGFLSSGKEGATDGALAGGCLAVGCLGRLFIIGLGILIVIWLFGLLFS